MIAIVNKGATSPREGKDHGGERRYDVKINSELIASFTHVRRDGLVVCLEKAAKAVRGEDDIIMDAVVGLFDPGTRT